MLEATGDKPGACVAYGAVLDRWGSTKRSVTASAASAREGARLREVKRDPCSATRDARATHTVIGEDRRGASMRPARTRADDSSGGASCPH